MYMNILPKQTKILNSWVFYTYDISHINSEQQHNQTEAYPFYNGKKGLYSDSIMHHL